MADKKESDNTPNNEDRNIAKVDVDTPGLTPEEELILLWDKYKRPVITIAVILVLGTIAWYGKKGMDSQKLHSFQSEFLKATEADQEAQNKREDAGNFDSQKDVESLENAIAFAEKHSSHPLGGHARLKAGHANFKVGNFQEAGSHYAAAANAFKGIPEMAGLAKLYQAISAWRNGDKEKGENLLTEVARGKDFLHEHRGEAFYKLGVIALSRMNLTEYQSWVTALENASLENAQTNWLENLKEFRNQFPKEGFDQLGPIPPKVVPPAPVPASSTGGTSKTGNLSPTGN
jgi:hypothetical protein